MDMNDFSLFVMDFAKKPPEVEEMIALARDAEELGFYSMTLPHTPRPPHRDDPVDLEDVERIPWPVISPELRDYHHDPFVVLPMLAQATSRIRIGFNVLVLPFFHPAVIAKYLASLDVASEGRVIAGLGIGWRSPGKPMPALDSYGINSRQRGAIADAALECVTQLWTQDGLVTFESEHLTVTELSVSPKPSQKPSPELWWAGEVQASIRRAARFGKYLNLGWPPLKLLREFYVPNLEKANAEQGGDARLLCNTFVEVLDRDLSPSELAEKSRGVEVHSAPMQWEASSTAVMGSPDRCAQVIREYREAGVAHFVLDFNRQGMDPVSTIHGRMARFVEEVVPLLA
jgi:alkanesulfonate monooxygenase SsuD/methylene tetrahydromethanopterin reductase-like flavin-dependent oxidoreductase (luciferase family)